MHAPNIWKKCILDAIRQGESIVILAPEDLMAKDIADYVRKNGYDIHIRECRSAFAELDPRKIKQTHKNGHVTVL